MAMHLFRFFKSQNVCRLLDDPQGPASRKFAAFKTLLTRNNEILDIMAGLEELYYGGGLFTLSGVGQACARLGEAVSELVALLNALSGSRSPALGLALERIMRSIRDELTHRAPALTGPLVLVLDLDQLGPGQDRLAGGKAANLARIRRDLHLPTPDGFVVTAAGFQAFMAHGDLGQRIRELLDGLSPYDLPDLAARTASIQRLIRQAEPPREMVLALHEAVAALTKRLAPGLDQNSPQAPLLAMRSSALGEDGRASFAGQYETILGVPPREALSAYKRVVAGKYTPTAILYRLRFGLDEEDTPMAVLGLAMVDSRASGVLYTRDPGRPGSTDLRVDALWGLGETLVSGQGAADTFSLNREPLAVTGQSLARKTGGLGLAPGGGTAGQDISEPKALAPALTEAQVLELGGLGLILEEYFQAPQDVEWAVDPAGQLFILQSRPLDLAEDMVGDWPQAAPESGDTESDGTDRADPTRFPGHDLLLSAGLTAARGAACGEVLVVQGSLPQDLPENPAQGSILVAPNAAPELAVLLDRVQGLITDRGSVASHLASVARELGIPALFETVAATRRLVPGQVVTLDATGRAVHAGRVEALLAGQNAPGTRRRNRLAGSPMHERLRQVLDQVAPLFLTDPDRPDFNPEGCRTIHDITRYAHEQALREMFGLADGTDMASHGGDGAAAVRLKAAIPLDIYCLDLGGGLRPNLTTCDQATPEDLRSVPMLALWRGFTHPGITWTGSVPLDARNLFTLIASSTAAEAGGDTPRGDSYALLSDSYLNLSARFGYHFANIDAFCGEVASQNHILVRFAGGAGNFTGKSLRLEFLTQVLGRLGFTLTVTGDVLDASLKGPDRATAEAALDQLGRLLASSRLLDMAIASQAQAWSMAESFFQGDYDFLGQRAVSPLPAFHLPLGDWERRVEDGQPLARQDGSRWSNSLTRGLAGLVNRLAGKRAQGLLDSMGAYFHFPLAVTKDLSLGDGRFSVQVRPVAGVVDQAAGLAFGVHNVGNLLVLRYNALEDNLVLFAFQEGRRKELARVSVEPLPGAWRDLAVEVRGTDITGFLDRVPLILFHFDRPVSGGLGLWTKADSVSDFRGLTVERMERPLCVVI